MPLMPKGMGHAFNGRAKGDQKIILKPKNNTKAGFIDEINFKYVNLSLIKDICPSEMTQLANNQSKNTCPQTGIQLMGDEGHSVGESEWPPCNCRTERKVAIKKIPKAFGALTLIKRTLREVQILRHFRHENIVAVLDMFQVPTSCPSHLATALGDKTKGN